MSTSYNLDFYMVDPLSPPTPPYKLGVVQLSAEDIDGNGQIEVDTDMIDGSLVTDIRVGDTLATRDGSTFVTYTGVTFVLADGRSFFMATDGQTLLEARYSSSTLGTPATGFHVGPVPCFLAGTMILTPAGEVPVETLRAGHLVVTRDRGALPLAWTGMRQVPGDGSLAPIRIAPGALGNARALVVSPQHRILLTGWRAELLFGEPEVLVAAKHLVDGDRIARMPMRMAQYHHIMFDRHEIVMAEGVATESFHPGAHVMDGDAAIRAELLALFPELETQAGRAGWKTARTVLRRREAHLLLAESAT